MIRPEELEIDMRDMGLEIVGWRQVRDPRWLWLRRKSIPITEERPGTLVFANSDQAQDRSQS